MIQSSVFKEDTFQDIIIDNHNLSHSLFQEAANEEKLAAEKKKLEEAAKKKAELEEEQRRISEENAAKQ